MDRLLEAYAVRTLVQLSERLGQKQSTVKNWRYRGSVPRAMLLKASKDTERSLEWLFTGDEPVLFARESRNFERSAPSAHLPPGSDLVSSSARRLRGKAANVGDAPSLHPRTMAPVVGTPVEVAELLTLPPAFKNQPISREYVVVPNIEVAARAGTGDRLKEAQRRIAASAMGVLAMDRAWMVQQLGRDDGDFATITVNGNSMSPTLLSGDTIIIDTLIDKIDGDGIYVLRSGESLVVKRVTVDFVDGSAVVQGDNDKHPVKQLQPATVRELRVVGRMVWPRLR